MVIKILGAAGFAGRALRREVEYFKKAKRLDYQYRYIRESAESAYCGACPAPNLCTQLALGLRALMELLRWSY